MNVDALIADLEIDLHRAREQAADGWIVVTVDDETGGPVNASGVFATAEAALVHAGLLDVELASIMEPGEAGWRHVVVPLFTPGSVSR